MGWVSGDAVGPALGLPGRDPAIGEPGRQGPEGSQEKTVLRIQHPRDPSIHPSSAAGDGDEHAGQDPGGSRMSAQRHTAQVPTDQRGAHPGRPFRAWNRLAGGEERKAAP